MRIIYIVQKMNNTKKPSPQGEALILHLNLMCRNCIAKQCIDINLLRDFRYVLKDSICCKQLDMSLSRRDLYHIEFEQSENISIYEVKYRANFSLHIDKNRFASKPYVSQYRYVERCREQKASLAKPSLPKGGGTALAVGGFRRGTTEGGGGI